MIKIVTIIGARPQIIKAAALSRAIREKYNNDIKEIIVHTGQHYDENMSEVFIKEMKIPSPDYNLNVGSSSHGKQTALMIDGIEEILTKEKPEYIVLYGDTNSTLAGAIAASKIHIPIVHIEAGLRSFSKEMPEEVNRILCDHVSTLLFTPTKEGYKNLAIEGFKETNTAPFNANNPGIFHCGDIMYDNSLFFSEKAQNKTQILSNNKINKGEYVLSTIHRNNNTDDIERLTTIFETLQDITTKYKLQVVLPLHPRTSKIYNEKISPELKKQINSNPDFIMLPPVSFLEMIALEQNSLLICTDSGGVQKESYFFHKPCIILRQETEWIEIVNNGTGRICDVDRDKIMNAFDYFYHKKDLSFPPIFGNGKAAEFMCNELIKNNNISNQ